MSSKLRSTILASDDRGYEDIKVSEWDTTIRIRGLDGASAEAFSRLIVAAGDELPENMMGLLLVRTIEDPETGELIFSEDDVAALTNKSGVVLVRLFTIAQRLSGLGELDDAKND